MLFELRELYDIAYPYYLVYSGLNKDMPEARKRKILERTNEAWNNIQCVNIRVVYQKLSKKENCILDFQKEQSQSEHNSDVRERYLYYIEVEDYESCKKSVSLECTEELWISAVIMAAKEWVEHQLEKSGFEVIASIAPGVDEVPLERIGGWTKILCGGEYAGNHEQLECDRIVKDDCTLKKNNSLLAMMIVCPL